VLVGATARRSGLAPQPVILTTVIDTATGPASVTTDTVNSPPALVGLLGTRMPPGHHALLWTTMALEIGLWIVLYAVIPLGLFVLTRIWWRGQRGQIAAA
jgi:hypothetical protein